MWWSSRSTNPDPFSEEQAMADPKPEKGPPPDVTILSPSGGAYVPASSFTTHGTVSPLSPAPTITATCRGQTGTPVTPPTGSNWARQFIALSPTGSATLAVTGQNADGDETETVSINLM
jgi:hypothetical protein